MTNEIHSPQELSQPNKNIIIFGAGRGITKVLSIITEKKLFNVKAVVPRVNRKTAEIEDSADLAELARTLDIEVIIHLDVNDPSFLQRLRVLAPKLIVNWGYGQIFKTELLSLAPLGVLNFHPGLLPNGRGSGAVVGEIWNSATEVGQVAHLMNKHIDSGTIIASRNFPISGFEYQDEINARLAKGADQFFVSAIQKVFSGAQGTTVRGFGRYFPKFANGDDIINWSEKSELIVKKIRSRSPYRLSRIFKNPEKQAVYVKKVSLSDVLDYYSLVGQVIDRSERGVLVKTIDNAIWIEEISYDGISFSIPNFPIGTTFISNWQLELADIREIIRKLNAALLDIRQVLPKKHERDT